MSGRACDVLVVGAGPTGLTLALWLRRLGVSVRIVDEQPAPGATTRAFAVHARTLELHDLLGFGHEAVARGVVIERFHFWIRGREAARLPFGHFGAGQSPFPFVLALGQDEHERLLLEKLAEDGAEVERATKLVAIHEEADRVLARLDGPTGQEVCEASYAVGCDGAHSTVREQIGARFPGGTYSRIFFVADVDASGPTADGEAHFCVRDEDFTLVFPVKRTGTKRLIGVVPEALAARGKDVAWSDFAEKVARDTRLSISKVHWFATYRVHHRVADRFREGRIFLAGDAGHIHSPAGGQGLNTGVGDAANLAWKLAFVLTGRARPRLLDTYEAERIPFARTLVETTDRLFELMVSPSAIARFTRTRLLPWLGPALLRAPLVRSAFFRRLSQVGIHYRESPLSEGSAGAVHGGDRLPYVAQSSRPLRALAWQVHVHGEATHELARTCQRLDVPLHVFAWSEPAEHAGLMRNAVYLIRPDGYIALAALERPARRLERFFERWAPTRVATLSGA